MGLLSQGTPLHWKEAKQYADHIREHGIKQLINIFHRLKDRQNDKLLWGDEVGCFLTRARVSCVETNGMCEQVSE